MTNRQVFINCPYDSTYYPLVEAIAFAVCVCGYTPRFAGETVDSGCSRLSKIMALIDGCAFSLHDISRTELNSRGLPRFNMPFELGLALGRRYSFEFGGAPRILILDSEPYRYHETISDLSGCDPVAHHSEPLRAIRLIREWLPLDEAAGSELRHPLKGPIRISSWFAEYQQWMRDVRTRLDVAPAALPFGDLVHSIRVWLESNSQVN